MGSFGRFLEISLPARDVLASLNFYRALGFQELAAGDIRPWHYAVVTDGSTIIGLHGGGLEEPAIAFVRPNLARQVRALEAAGQDFEFVRLGPDEFNEAALRTPDGQMILMMEARTFSPGPDGDPATALIGQCSEVRLSCADRAASQAFFERAGFLVAEDDGSGITRLLSPGLTLALHAGGRQPLGALQFTVPDTRLSLQRLEESGLRVDRHPEGHLLTAPEGTRLLMVG